MEMNYKDKLNLLKKLHAILVAVDYIEKDARNTNANYNYASEKAIKLTMHAAFAKFGVMQFVDMIEAHTLDVKTSGGEQKIMAVQGICTFVDVETGESISVNMIGSGNGRDDKGIYAALTGIIKYSLTSAFLIPTGDDAEADGDRVPTFRQVDPPVVPAKPVEAPKEVAPVAPEQTKPAVPAKKGASKAQPPAKPAVVPVQANVVAPEVPEKRHDFGHPQPGDPKITEADMGKIVGATMKFEVGIDDIELKAGYGLEQFTFPMKTALNLQYQVLKAGRCTKEQFMASRDVVKDFPATV